MWTIHNETPFSAAGTVMQHWRTHRKLWTVAVKATFDIHNDGEVSVSEKQEEVLAEPVFNGIEYQSSLKYDADLTHAKENVDVILNATGYQPENREETELTVGVAIGRWSKTLVIKGQRHWDRFLGIPFATHPSPFKKMAVSYENAFGGRDGLAKAYFQDDLRNPVGVSYAYRKYRLKHKPLPAIEYPDFPTKAHYRKNRIAGFGAIPGYWQPRIGHAGTYDQHWEENRSPFPPLDFSPCYFQCAPEDQQLNSLNGGEIVTLYNLMATNAIFRFTLPRISIECVTAMDRSILVHEGNLQTVIIEPDIPRLLMVWHTGIDCDNAEESVTRTTVSHQPAELNTKTTESS